MNTRKKQIILVSVPILIVLLTAVVFALGPAYQMQDSCTCGRIRQWYSFDECNFLRASKFHMVIVQEGVTSHQHLYRDPTWNKQYTLLSWIKQPKETGEKFSLTNYLALTNSGGAMSTTK